MNMPNVSQPGAAPIERPLIDHILADPGVQTAGAAITDIVHRDQHSNDVTEVRFDDGRTLMVKRGRYEWTRARFETSRIAAALLKIVGIRAPDPLPIRSDHSPQALEVYWRIDLPTLEEVWPDLDGAQRETVLRDWGRLIARVHSVPQASAGTLLQSARRGVCAPEYLRTALHDRLLPSVRGTWPAGVPVVERLLEALCPLGRHLGELDTTLLHNDPHMGNILCEQKDGEIRCVGLLDLESALAGPREADLAMLDVLHGPLCGNPLQGRWFDVLQGGYARALDPVALAFFRVYHTANMGFYSALIGHELHAGELARSALEDLARLEDGIVSVAASVAA
jgi:aminoglycoside phosphotransferase (APT) family kinase protein